MKYFIWDRTSRSYWKLHEQSRSPVKANASESWLLNGNLKAKILKSNKVKILKLLKSPIKPLYKAKLSGVVEVVIKKKKETFRDINRLRESAATKPELRRILKAVHQPEERNEKQNEWQIKLLIDNYEKEQKQKRKKKEKKTAFQKQELNINSLSSLIKKEKLTEQINKKNPSLCVCICVCVCKETSYLQR